MKPKRCLFASGSRDAYLIHLRNKKEITVATDTYFVVKLAERENRKK